MYADTKKRRERRLYRLRLKREANPGTRFNEVPDKHKPKMPQGARGQVQCNIGSQKTQFIRANIHSLSHARASSTCASSSTL
ncbi:TPA: hypothetical protein ACIX5L_004456, partial [Escherichia coli]